MDIKIYKILLNMLEMQEKLEKEIVVRNTTFTLEMIETE